MRLKKGEILAAGIASVVLAFIANRAISIFADCLNLSTLVERISWTLDHLGPSLSQRPFYFDFSAAPVKGAALAAAIVWMVWLYFAADVRQYMVGREHGSARWGTKADIAPLMDKDSDANIILSASEQIAVGKARSFEADRNKNVLIVGGPGSGKTYSLYKPNLMQLHSSYVVTDPKGTMLPECGYLFTENGYELRSFNTVNFERSMHYNPLAYIHNEKDILKVVNVLITNTSDENAKGGDEFWTKCERLLYSALIAYLWQEAPPEDQTIPTMIDLLGVADVREEDEEYQSPLDIIFEDLAQVKPDCFAVRQYRSFKKAAGKTMKSILISCAARLSPFDIPELREIMSYDELGLDTLGDRKTALFIIMSDTDTTFSFIIAMIMYQMFNLLCEKADDQYGGKLPVHVRCLLDEFANIGKIPDFEHLITTIRSREISATIALQSLSQLEPLYDKNAETIIDGCDSLVFLGGKSTKTTEELAKMVGKATISAQNTSESKGINQSYTIQDQGLGRDLIDAAEIGKLARGECLVLITGLPPFRSQKYNTSQHKRFEYLADSHQRPRFDFERMRDQADQAFFEGVSEVLISEEVAVEVEETLTVAQEPEDSQHRVDLSELNNL